jgi:uncharacterized protein
MVLKLLLVTMVGAAARARYAEPVAPKAIVAAALTDLEMEPSPIEPSWIIAGTPVARSSIHSRSTDDQATTVIWDCTAGAFNWHFGWDETVVILEGEVQVTGEDGTMRLLKVGDIAYFPAGSSAIWRIDDYVRKIAFGRRTFPGAISMALKLREKFKH